MRRSCLSALGKECKKRLGRNVPPAFTQRAQIHQVRGSLFVLALTLGVELVPVQALIAKPPTVPERCTGRPDHWFNATIHVDPSSLPPGVTTESAVAGIGRTGIYLTNSSNVPLIINPPDPHKVYYESYPRPLTMKLVSGEGYYCDVRSKPMRCEMNSRINKANAQVETPEISKAVLAGWVAKDDRPLDVKIPDPRPFQFFALYEDQLVTIKGTVSFSLNDHYDPQMGVKTAQWCNAGNEVERQLAYIKSFAAKMPKEWLSCRMSKDCGLVWFNCMEGAFASNTHHLKDAQAVNCQTELCSWLKCPYTPAAYSASCEDGQCVTRRNAQDQSCLTNPSHCACEENAGIIVLWNRANALIAQKQFEAAKVYLNRIVANKPGNACEVEAKAQLALCQMHLSGEGEKTP